MLAGKYKILYDRLVMSIDRKRMFHDPMYTLAYGTDASFYRLIPRIVIRAKDENEVSTILKTCSDLSLPVTFRAAGTSLSGQSVTDSVLLIAGSDWNEFRIKENGLEIRLQPGLTGGRVNSLLAPYGRKIGPDPASINAAMVGGIAANNASGMCCGTAENSYKTISGIRIIFADGTLLDTSDESSKQAFRQSHPELLSDIHNLAREAAEDLDLSEKIRKKYKMKNTTGYSLNALIDYSDPFDIIEHLMIGSEGTLGFIAGITYRTVIDHPCKASALLIFPDIETACKAVIYLKPTPVSAVELIDRAGLRSVENEKGIPDYLKSLQDEACALLVETVANDNHALLENIKIISDSIISIPMETGLNFTSVRSEYEQLWKIRKGLFPSVGAMRRTGTTVIIEDVAFPVPLLAEATIDLQNTLKKYSYDDAVIFGHALEGNLHFVFSQDFNTPDELGRYAQLMSDIADLVVNKYDGSLKAEHGTGRNMAPFVELEWGHQAYELMKRIKQIFDPLSIMNPGVILNDDKEVHLKDIKPLYAASELIDKCTECGFCEPSCVSAGLTLTPRQRIVISRELSSLRHSRKEPHIAALLEKSFSYPGVETCAADGLCALSCPVKIDTGKLIKKIRSENIKSNRVSLLVAKRMNLITSVARKILSMVDFFHIIFGQKTMLIISKVLRFITARMLPLWNTYLPLGAKKIKLTGNYVNSYPRKVVYFPSCINRSMGVSREYAREKQLTDIMVDLLHKAGYEAIYPENLNSLCCGMAFSSKGYTLAGEKKSAELETELMKASQNGKYPILCDMSPCLFTIRENLRSDLKVFEPVEFISEFLLPWLNIKPVSETVTVFPVCSMKKMDLDNRLTDLAKLCAREVIVPVTNCCGFAGDKGFTYPELNNHGLHDLKSQLHPEVKHGYSNSRTCEIGLSLHSGISYKSIVYLVDKVSSPIREY